MFTVDPETKLFIALEDGETKELLVLCTKYVFQAHVNLSHPAYLEWLTAVGLQPTLADISWSTAYTAFVQRAMLSVAQHKLHDPHSYASDESGAVARFNSPEERDAFITGEQMRGVKWNLYPPMSKFFFAFDGRVARFADEHEQDLWVSQSADREKLSPGKETLVELEALIWDPKGQVEYARQSFCATCRIEMCGCACDGSHDDGCFLCTPAVHTRPACPIICHNFRNRFCYACDPLESSSKDRHYLRFRSGEERKNWLADHPSCFAVSPQDHAGLAAILTHAVMWEREKGGAERSRNPWAG